LSINFITKMGKQQKKQEVPETANVKSSGVSTFFVIVLFGILGVGCGVGYQHIMEQLELNNNALVAKIGSLQDEISSVKESQASISFENEIATIGQLKEDLQSTRLQMNVEADNINQVKSGLAIVKTNVEGLNKNVVEAKQSANSAQEKVSGSIGDIEILKGSLENLLSDSKAVKTAVDSKLAQAHSALAEQSASTTQRINAAETELATKISSAIEEAVAAKQLADESKQAVADASIANEQKLNDKLEQIKQNIEYLLAAKQSADESKQAVAEASIANEQKLNDKLEQIKQNIGYLMDGRKSNEAKMADLASSLNSALSAVVHKSDLDEINGEISSMKTTIEKVQSSSADQSKSLADAIKSFKGKADRLNANIKMTTNEMNGIREMVTNMVAMNEDATEAPPLEE